MSAASLIKSLRLREKNGKRLKPGRVPYVIQDAHSFTAVEEKKRKVIMQIKRNEEIKATRNRLRAVLMQKLANKFKRVPRKIIQSHVDEFVVTKLQINANDLIQLEQKIASFDEGNIESTANALNKLNLANESEAKISFNGPECNSREGTRDGALPYGAEWEALQLYNTLRADEREKREEDRRKAKQLELKKALDKQIQEAKERKEREKYSDAEYVAKVKADYEKFTEEEFNRTQQLHERHELERTNWERQIEEEKERRRQEALKLLEMEKLNLRNIQHQIDVEKQNQLAKKEEEHRKHLLILEENERNKEMRAIQKQKDAEEDHRLMQMYAKKQDDEAKAREEAFQRRVEALAKFAKFADEGAVGKGRREEEQRFELMLLREQQKREEREKNREITDAQNKKNRVSLMMQENLRQLDQQKKLAEEEKMKDKAYANKFREERLSYEAELRESKRRGKEERLRYGKTLMGQIYGSKEDLDIMNANERSLNADTLKALIDPNVYGRIRHRLRINSAKANNRDHKKPTPPGTEKKSKNNWVS